MQSIIKPYENHIVKRQKASFKDSIKKLQIAQGRSVRLMLAKLKIVNQMDQKKAVKKKT
jgi:hypothetical protein